jgi:hypothetical protein
MLALQALQSARLRRDLADLAAETQYKSIGEFFAAGVNQQAG